MQKSLVQNSFVQEYLGNSRYHCHQALLAAGVESIAFAHWLAVPSQRLLLVFRNQHCVAIDCYQAGI